jgi:hypothetical protein
MKSFSDAESTANIVAPEVISGKKKGGCCTEPQVSIDLVGPSFIALTRRVGGFFGVSVQEHYSIGQQPNGFCPPLSYVSDPCPGPDVIRMKVSLPGNSIGRCRVIGGNLLGWVKTGSAQYNSYLTQVNALHPAVNPLATYTIPQERGYVKFADFTSVEVADWVRQLCPTSPPGAALQPSVQPRTGPVNSGFGIASPEQYMSIAFGSYPLSFQAYAVQGLFNVGIVNEDNKIDLYTYDFYIPARSRGYDFRFFATVPAQFSAPRVPVLTLHSKLTFSRTQATILFGETADAIVKQSVNTIGLLKGALVNRLGITGLQVSHQHRPIGGSFANFREIATIQDAKVNGLPVDNLPTVGIGQFWSDPSGWQPPRTDCLPDICGYGGVDGRNVAFFPGIT